MRTHVDLHAQTLDLIAQLESVLPPSLVTPQSFGALQKAAQSLPAHTTGVVFETRLADTNSRCDLTLVISQAQRNALLSELSEKATPIAAQLVAFLQTWADQQSPLAALPMIAYECDILGDDLGAFIYPCVQPQFNRGLHAVAADRAQLEARRLTRAVLDHLDGPSKAPRRKHFENALDRLPAAAYICYATSLAQRPLCPQPVLRVTLSFPAASLVPYLAAIGWDGDESRVQELIVLCRKGGARIPVDLDFGDDGIEARIGLVADFEPPRESDPYHRAILGYLAEHHLASQRKLEGVRAWLRVAERSAIVADRAARTLGYKFILDNDTVQVKAYLSAYA